MHRTIIGETLARVLISRITKIAWRAIIINKSELGKPYVSKTNIEFNVSHSGNWIVCGVALKKIGVDIERIEPIDFNIVKHYFTEKEEADLYNLQPESRKAYFYELWTLKESYLKAQGIGLNIALNSFSVRAKHPEQIHFEGLDSRGIRFRMYNQFDHYKMAVCSADGSFPDRVAVLTWDELYGMTQL